MILIVSPTNIPYISLTSCLQISGCRVDGDVGSGTTQGNCGANEVCQATGQCTGN